MTNILKNDGTWTAKPSGLKKGDLNGWRKMMYDARPEPEVDDIIIDKRVGDDELIGYLCTVADGKDSYWKRVSKPIKIESIQQHMIPQNQQKGGKKQFQGYQNQSFGNMQQPAQPAYNQAAAQYNEPSMDFDDDIPFFYTQRAIKYLQGSKS